MNYQQYLQGQSDFNLRKPRQSINKDYVRGYSEELANWLSCGNTICYDWDINTSTPQGNTLFVIATVADKVTNTIWKVKDIRFRYPKTATQKDIKELQKAIDQPYSNLVHAAQIIHVEY